MKTRWLLSVLMAVGLAAFAVVGTPAQTGTTAADRFKLNTGPCILRSGSGSPETVVTGNLCDTYWRTDSATLYVKTDSGDATGWSAVLSATLDAGTVLTWGGDTNLYRSAANVLKTDDYFTAGGTNGFTIGSLTGAARIVFVGGTYYLVNASDADAPLEIAQLTAYGHLLPGASATYDVGGGSTKWKDGYFSGTLNAGPVSVAGDIKPTTGNSRDLGDGTLYFRHLYFNPETTTSGDPPLVYSTTNKKPYYRTDTYNTTASGAPVTSLTAAYGLVTSVSTTSGITSSSCGSGWVYDWSASNGVLTALQCSTLEAQPSFAALLDRVTAMERELVALRAEVAALKAAEVRR